MANDSDPLIDTNEAAAFLGLTPARIRQLDDVLVPMRIGKRRVFRLSAIESFAAHRDHERASKGSR